MLIREALDLDSDGPNIAAVVGCGGKTTLIERLAEDCRGKRVLISPTTKMYPPKIPGVDCLGRINSETGKLGAAPAEELKAAVSRYWLALLEADGSRGLPCKGWIEREPAVPDYCTHTVGIITLNALGKPATKAYVHRLPEFLAMTGLREGDRIDQNALAAMILSSGGMFKNSAGKRFLLVNQIEDAHTAVLAQYFLRDIKKQSRNMLARMLFGSARRDCWTEE